MSAMTPVLALMAVMLLGWWLKRRGHIGPTTEEEMNWLLFHVLMPASIFTSGLRFRPELLGGWHYLTALYVSFVVVMAVAWVICLYRRLPPERTATSVLMSVRGNILYVALPLLALSMGETGQEVIALYVAVGMLFYNFFPILAAQICLSGHLTSDKLRNCLAATIKNPVLLAGFVGIAMAATGTTDWLPEPLVQAIGLLSRAAIGLALLSIGASLEMAELRVALRSCWPDLAIKLVLLPATLCLAFHVWPLADRTTMIATVIVSSVSHAFNCYIFARGMGMDAPYASSTLACGTVIGLGSTVLWMLSAPLLVP